MSKRSKAETNLLECQQIAVAAIRGLKLKGLQADGTILFTHEQAKQFRDLTASLDVTLERLRILRGKPLPGSLRPQKNARSPKASTVAFPVLDGQQAASS